MVRDCMDGNGNFWETYKCKLYKASKEEALSGRAHQEEGVESPERSPAPPELHRSTRLAGVLLKQAFSLATAHACLALLTPETNDEHAA